MVYTGEPENSHISSAFVVWYSYCCRTIKFRATVPQIGLLSIDSFPSDLFRLGVRNACHTVLSIDAYSETDITLIYTVPILVLICYFANCVRIIVSILEFNLTIYITFFTYKLAALFQLLI